MHTFPKRYKTKPIEIEAIEFTKYNIEEIKEFAGDAVTRFRIDLDTRAFRCSVATLEGVTTAEEGDFIIKGIHGEFYSCKPDIFHKKYILLEDI